MNAADIRAMFQGVPQDAKHVLSVVLRQELMQAIRGVNQHLASHGTAELMPRPELVLHAFRACAWADIKCVILGQDPYPRGATGMSFSATGAVPGSLRTIFECLHAQGLTPDINTDPDLGAWARQGVLLLNAALTTTAGASNQHAAQWSEYTDGILREVCRRDTVVVILLGAFARKKRALCGNHTVLEWGHPSGLNPQNQRDNPQHFRYCTVFARCNEALQAAGLTPIDWRTGVLAAPTPAPTPAEPPVTWVFTDGASTANGKANCRASWAFHVHAHQLDAQGEVQPAELGQVYRASNQRGELMAIWRALECVEQHALQNVIVVSDSEYGIGCLDVWVQNWIDKNTVADMKNTDIILPAKRVLDQARARTSVRFLHTRSHRPEPAANTPEWHLWNGNRIVDSACARVLAQ